MKSLPNIISVFRLCMVPAFIFAYALETSPVRYITITVFAVANISDVIDGYIARKYNAGTELGRLLDPLADKLTIFTALVCIATTRPVLIWVACLYFIKEILMGAGGILIVKRRHTVFPSSNWMGKTATVIFFFACVSVIAFQAMPDNIAVILFSIAMLAAAAAFINYLYLYARLMKKNIQNTPPENTAQPGVSPEDY